MDKIQVLSGNTTVGWYESVEDVAARFTPLDGRWQDYWYKNVTRNVWIHWMHIRDAAKYTSNG